MLFLLIRPSSQFPKVHLHPFCAPVCLVVLQCFAFVMLVGYSFLYSILTLLFSCFPFSPFFYPSLSFAPSLLLILCLSLPFFFFLKLAFSFYLHFFFTSVFLFKDFLLISLCFSSPLPFMRLHQLFRFPNASVSLSLKSRLHLPRFTLSPSLSLSLSLSLSFSLSSSLSLSLSFFFSLILSHSFCPYFFFNMPFACPYFCCPLVFVSSLGSICLYRDSTQYRSLKQNRLNSLSSIYLGNVNKLTLGGV